MDRYLEAAYSATPPSAPAASSGYPTNGNPLTATPASEPGEWWFHMVTEELRAVIAAAGITPNHADIDQILEALPGALASRPEMGRSLAASGYQRFPGGLIVQWGIVGDGSLATADAVITGTFPLAFPTACCSIVASIDNSAAASSSNWGCYARATSSAGFTVVMDMASSTSFNKRVNWMAIGY